MVSKDSMIICFKRVSKLKHDQQPKLKSVVVLLQVPAAVPEVPSPPSLPPSGTTAAVAAASTGGGGVVSMSMASPCGTAPVGMGTGLRPRSIALYSGWYIGVMLGGAARKKSAVGS